MAKLETRGYNFNAFDRICKACAERGALSEDEIECPHVILRSGTNKSTEKRKLMTKITLDSELNAIENQGKQLELETGVFKDQSVSAFGDSVDFSSLTNLRYVVLTFDPDAGGGCYFTGNAWTYLHNRWVLLWADHTISASPTDHISFFLNSIRAVSKRFRKRDNCCIAVCIEANSRVDAGHVDMSIRTSVDPEMRDVVIITDHTKSNQKMPGVLLGAERKREMIEDFAIRLNNRSVVIHKEFFTTHAKGEKHVIAMMMQQLRVFRKVGKKYTGKVSGNQDDYVIVLAMGPLWGKMTIERKEYQVQLSRVGFKGL